MINKGASLLDADHVVRYVSFNRLRRDAEDNVIGVLPQAFEMRATEDALSVGWLEYFEGDKAQRVKNSILQIRSVRSTGANSCFAIGNVGRIKEVCTGAGAKVKVVYWPNKGNLAHAQIKRLPAEAQQLRASLAAEAFTELIKNSDIEAAVPAEAAPAA